MKRTHKWMIFTLAAAALVLIAAGANPQLSLDEQDAIVAAVVQTMNPEAMKATVVAEVEADLIEKFQSAGYLGLVAALSAPSANTPEPAEPTPMPTEEVPAETEEPIITNDAKDEGSDSASSESTETQPRQIDSAADYWNGAVLQEDGTYRGLHAKQVNAYAYTIGEDENGVVKQFHTEYTPNVRFNVDVVFENDGSVIWPARIEMRHIGNVGEYTGHAESIIVDRSLNPVKPGDRCAFTVSAYGSENLGWTTFYFKLYDADSGSVIEGGEGSFTYHAI